MNHLNLQFRNRGRCSSTSPGIDPSKSRQSRATRGGGKLDHSPHESESPPMTPGDEIMTPVSKPEAVAMAEIHALRQISDALSATNQSLHALAHDVREVRADVKEVREKVIRMEGEDLKAQLREVRADFRSAIKRIDDLEGIRDQQRGAKGLVDWLRQTAPWLAAMALGIVGWFGGKA